MNNGRRKERDRITKQLSIIKQDVIFLREDEVYAMECVPENLQGGESYANMEEAVDGLSDAIESISGAIESLTNI